MTSGLEATFSVLTKTQNEAAVRVLLGALDAPDHHVQAAALEALLARRSPTAQRELLQRWHTLSERWKNMIAESSSRLSHAIRDAVLSRDEQLHRNGCDAAIVLCEYDLIPALLTAAEEPSNPHAGRSAETLLLLADSLCEALTSPRDYQNRRAPHVIHTHVVGALEQSVERFDHHRRREIVEAFLMLAGRENPVLDHVLQHPHDKAYVTLLHLLAHSPRPGIMRLILDSLDSARAPSAIYSILARRKDVSFVRHMLKRFADEVPKTARRNLKRIDSFGWLSDDLNLLTALNEQEQRGAVHLTMASGMNRIRVFQVIDYVLAHGAAGARREAAETLIEFRGAEANAAVARMLDDDDPQVRAIAVRQLRERGIRGAMTTLLELVDCPDEEVRQAARASLEEFNFDRFLVTFAALDDAARAETGYFVKRIDSKAVSGLQTELQSPMRVRRIRAIQMAIAMTAVPETESLIIDLLSDDDHITRAIAAEALAQSPSAASWSALRQATLDRSQTVRDAAAQSLQAFAASELLTPPVPMPLPWDANAAASATESTGGAVS